MPLLPLLLCPVRRPPPFFLVSEYSLPQLALTNQPSKGKPSAGTVLAFPLSAVGECSLRSLAAPNGHACRKVLSLRLRSCPKAQVPGPRRNQRRLEKALFRPLAVGMRRCSRPRTTECCPRTRVERGDTTMEYDGGIRRRHRAEDLGRRSGADGAGTKGAGLLVLGSAVRWWPAAPSEQVSAVVADRGRTHVRRAIRNDWAVRERRVENTNPAQPIFSRRLAGRTANQYRPSREPEIPMLLLPASVGVLRPVPEGDCP